MSQPLIIGAVSLAAIDTVVTDLRGKSKDSNSPSFRIVIGGFVTIVALLALSDYNEELADTLALIILLATLFGPNGGGLADFLNKAMGPDAIRTQQIGAGIVQDATKGVNIAGGQTTIKRS